MRENLILDCCRVLLPDLVTDSVENFGLKKAAAHYRELDLAKCRRCYDKSISECQTGCNVLYGCDIGETSGESEKKGGYYSTNLLKVARDWENKKNLSLSPNCYAVLSVPHAHTQTVPLVKSKKATQNPQISPYAIDFPWAIAAY